MKPWYESKTVWVNLATILAALLAVPEVTGIIPLAAMPYLLAINATAGIVLRVLYTDRAIGDGNSAG